MSRATLQKGLAWLDAVFSHNAVVAILSAGLALWATWYIDSRAEARAERAEMHRVIDEIISDMAAHRFAVEQAVALAYEEEHLTFEDRFAAVVRARAMILDAAGPANARLTGQVQRLSRYFAIHAPNAVNPMEVIADGPVANIVVMIRCATNVLDIVDAGTRALASAAHQTCDGWLPANTSDEDRARLAALDGVGFAERVNRHIACTSRLLPVLHAAVDDADVAQDALSQGMAACGTQMTSEGLVFLPLTLTVADVLP